MFDAIASREGLSAWWTNQVDGDGRLGTVLVFRFGGSSTVFRMRVQALEKPRRVEWLCIGDNEEWKDTRLTFEIAKKEKETVLRFTQAGWRSAEGWIADCSYTWAHVLARLKPYAETGERAAYFS